MRLIDADALKNEESHQEAVEFGCKTAKIYILEDKNEIQIDKKHAHIWRAHPVSD